MAGKRVIPIPAEVQNALAGKSVSEIWGELSKLSVIPVGYSVWQLHRLLKVNKVYEFERDMFKEARIWK